jgi:hypothetical protein
LETSAHPFIQIPKGFISEYRQRQQLNCGWMNIECPDCGALHWIIERISTSPKSSPWFSSSPRYCSPTEGCWQIFEYRTHEEWPPIIKLAVHLPDQYTYIFKKHDIPE